MFPICPRLEEDYDYGYGGLGPLQLANQLLSGPLVNPSYGLLRTAQNLARSLESEVQNTDKEFRIRLQCQDYEPNEVKIACQGNRVTVTAKHEERADKHGHGHVSRQMTRVYTLPQDVDAKSLNCSMNSQGILCMKAQKLAIEDKPQDRPIPVEFKG